MNDNDCDEIISKCVNHFWMCAFDDAAIITAECNEAFELLRDAFKEMR